MRKVIVAEFLTLDGYVAGPNEEMDWAMVDANDLKPEWDTIILGRVTYEMWAEFWPTATQNENPMADFINAAPKVVFSRALEAAPWGKWNNVQLVRDVDPETIAELKSGPGGNMAILGSSRLVQSFLNHDLVDEYLLIVFPVILGSGKPLFAGIHTRHNLRLIETFAMNNGGVVLRYRPA